MKRESIPWSIKFFKTKIYFLDKEAEFKYNLEKIKKNEKIKGFFTRLKRLISIFWKNFKENADNWNYRANADMNFEINI